MSDDPFAAVDSALAAGSAAGALDLLSRRFREAGDFGLLFEARLMRARIDLGLPAVQTDAVSTFPPAVRAAYEDAMIAAARETGQLYLEAGNIEAGYRYLRAVGDTEAVATALGAVEPDDQNAEALIAIAFQEGVHPVRGLQMILDRFGICRAITAFGMTAVARDRERCIHLLVNAIHTEITQRIRYAIEQRESAAPDAGAGFMHLIAGRDWLFGEYDSYVDPSHVQSVIPYALETNDETTLALLADLCAYGQRLSQNYRFPGPPPFEDGYVGYGRWIAGDADYFRAQCAQAPEAAEVLVNLLVRARRYAEALDVSLEWLSEEDPTQLRCPSPLQLCHLAGDFGRMRDLARRRNDLLSYTAACLLRT